jgi:hypothetical protein
VDVRRHDAVTNATIFIVWANMGFSGTSPTNKTDSAPLPSQPLCHGEFRMAQIQSINDFQLGNI